MKRLDERSRPIRASFGSREKLSRWFTSTFGPPSELALVVFLVFSVWNAINDPLVGYLLKPDGK